MPGASEPHPPLPLEAVHELLRGKVPMSAVISDCGQYRYLLERDLGNGIGQRCTFIMLNPSTADGEMDDPTIRRCKGFARAWGYGQLAVVTLFAYRTPDPRQLRAVDDPVGPKNDDYVRDVVTESAMVVAAWGAHGRLYRRADCVRGMLERDRVSLHYLRLGEHAPSHPLYLPKDLTPIRWEDEQK